MNKQLLKIRCLTNLHAGSGDINFDIIDDQVEKDPITRCPVIFASGVKGALREYATQRMSKDDVEDIFGVDRADNGKRMGKGGNVKFLTAQMLARPMRASQGKQSYYMVTSKAILKQFCQMWHDLYDLEQDLIKDVERLDPDMTYHSGDQEMEIGVEGYAAGSMIPQGSKDLRKFLKDTFPQSEIMVILPEQYWKKVELPVVARNHLENGKSVNLWYEEIVPHKSEFYTYVLSNGTPLGDKSLEKLLTMIEKDPLIQFGGNATIGNGLTIVERWDPYE